MKKILAMLLALVMLFGMVACAQSNEDPTTPVADNSNDNVSNNEAPVEEAKEPVTLTWWWPGNGPMPDTEMVNEAFNELLHTYEGMEHVSVVFKDTVGAEYAQALTLGVASEEPMDIVGTCALFCNYNQLVEDGILMDITSYLESYPDLVNEYPEWLWEYMAVGDGTYAVPSYQRASNMWYFVVRKDLMDKYGDYDKMTKAFQDPNATSKDYLLLCEEFLKAIREGEKDDQLYIPNVANMKYLGGYYWDTISGRFAVTPGTSDLSYWTINEEYEAYWREMARLYTEGLAYEEAIDLDKAEWAAGNPRWAFNFKSYMGDAETASAYFTNAFGYEVTAIPMSTSYYVGRTWAAGGNAVSAFCEHPEDALNLLQLMATTEGKELYNMLVYGIEGVHYEKTGDNTIKTFDYDGTQAGSGARYGTWKWEMGNAFNAYLNQGSVEGANEMELAINENPDNVVSLLIGFVPDLTEIQSKLDQINAVDGEFYNGLRFGTSGAKFDEYFADYVEKLKVAGLDEVMENLQEQLDAFLASK